MWADRRFRLGRGKVFALYVALYGFGRIFTEHIRLDYSYEVFGPIRFNEAVAMLICLAGIVAFVLLTRFRPGREDVVEFGPEAPDATVAPSPGEDADAAAEAPADDPRPTRADGP